MKLTTLLLVIGVLAALGLVGALAAPRGRKATGDLRARRPLTEREQAMYFRLVSAFPQHVVLAQVAFSALLESKDKPTRSTFDRKVADFVVCGKDFTPAAVIELDDASHRGREASDAKRGKLLSRAGYRVVRFKTCLTPPSFPSCSYEPGALARLRMLDVHSRSPLTPGLC